MPTYEYECAACKQRVEFFQGIAEAPKRKCPACGAPRGLKRLIGAGAGLIFRGSGFYSTDYRSKDYRERARAESGEGSKADGSGEKETSKKAQSPEKKEPGTSQKSDPGGSESPSS